MNTIARAVEPLRSSAVDRAVYLAKQTLIEALVSLESNDWNATIVAPYPKSSLSRTDYKSQYEFYRFVRMITEHDSVRSLNKRFSNEYRIKSIKNEESFLKRVAESAGFAYDAFIAKLEGKIGEVEEEEVILHGDHVWDHSILTVTKKDGNTERWSTKTIWNRSKFGKVFIQFPTRKLK